MIHLSLCVYTYIHSLNEIIQLTLTMLPSRATDYLTKPPIPGMRNPLQLDDQSCLRDSHNNRGIAIILDCLSEVEGESLLLKTLC